MITHNPLFKGTGVGTTGGIADGASIIFYLNFHSGFIRLKVPVTANNGQ